MINPDLIMKEESIDSVKDSIRKWYNQDKHHYVTVNAIDNGETLTLDWIFSEYETKNKIYVFRVENVGYNTQIPTMTDFLSCAWVSEWDLADMFDLNIENAHRGMFLQPDAPKAPLRKESYSGK